MSHLAARPSLGLTVEMQGEIFAGKLAPAVHIGADQIGHDRIAVAFRVAERPAGNGPDMVLELAHEAAVDGPMTGVVYSWRDLIDQEPRSFAFAQKHFHAEYANIAERLGNLAGDMFCFDGAIGMDAGGRAADGKDAVLVHVLN